MNLDARAWLIAAGVGVIVFWGGGWTFSLLTSALIQQAALQQSAASIGVLSLGAQAVNACVCGSVLAFGIGALYAGLTPSADVGLGGAVSAVTASGIASVVAVFFGTLWLVTQVAPLVRDPVSISVMALTQLVSGLGFALVRAFASALMGGAGGFAAHTLRRRMAPQPGE